MTENLYMFGDNVKSRRNSLGMSQADLAKAVGKEQQNIQQIESGVVSQPRYMQRLLVALNCSYEELSTGIFKEINHGIGETQERYGRGDVTAPVGGLQAAGQVGTVSVITRIQDSLNSGKLSENDLILIEQIADRLKK